MAQRIQPSVGKSGLNMFWGYSGDSFDNFKNTMQKSIFFKKFLEYLIINKDLNKKTKLIKKNLNDEVSHKTSTASPKVKGVRRNNMRIIFFGKA